MIAQRLKSFLLHRYTLIFLFCFAAIQGPAFSLMDNYDPTTNADCITYIGLAKLDFNQSPVRRYRVIIPLMAAGIDRALVHVMGSRKPISFPGDFPLALSFFIVNCFFVSVWGIIIYRFCRACGVPAVESLLGLLVMLTCRWTPYIAGVPLTDSLYCVAVGLALLGIVEKNERAIAISIFLGPFAKEAFIFIAPVIFFFSHVGKARLMLYFILSGILVFSFHRAYDYFLGVPAASGLEADMYHFQYVRDNLKKLFSFHGIYDVLSCFGVWILLPIGAWWLAPKFRDSLRHTSGWYMLLFAISILVHMLLSGYFERMILLAMPIICMLTALAMARIREKYFA